MRELKFRAYDKVEKEMLTIIEMDWYPDHTLRYLKAIDKDGKEWYYDSPDDIKENLTIEQFTGLKDKNGKEIYEGDILEYYYETHGQTFYDPDTLGAVGGEPGIETAVIGRVAIWPSTGVVLTGIKAKYPEDFDSNDSDIPKTLHVNKRFEVVGNIHEDSQLLEAE